MANMDFIENFLSSVEGPRQVRGYIPCHVKSGGTANYKGQGDPENYSAMGASGVTIATGCDLGQTDAATLLGYNLDRAIVNIFTPYLGKRKADAIRRLHEAPLVITPGQARLTDIAVHHGYLDRYVRPAYEKASRLRFDSIPPQAQAVIMSVCFQKGCGGVRKDWPRLWSHLIAGNWKAATDELFHGFTQYQGRRRKEAMLLESIQ